MKPSTIVKTIFLVGCIICIRLVSYSQNPNAAFSASPTSGCAPLLVSFSNQSTGNPNSFKWVLGNGTISNLQNPTTLYTNPGQYSVKLIVQNSNGIDSITKESLITVFSNPTVIFSASSLNSCVNSMISYFDSSLAGSGSISSRLWDFGDGTSSNAYNPSHSYSSSGYFNVSLRITNSNGCTQSLTKTNYISILPKPTANFQNQGITSCTNPLTISFLNTSSESNALSCQWNFGDGNSSTNINPTHVYTDFGHYSVSLKVSNAHGCQDSIKKINLINITNLRANFTIPTSACMNSPIQIQNTTTPNPQSVLWDFGDGSTSRTFAPQKTYNNADTFRIKLKVQFNSCRDSITHDIIINQNPVAAFSANPQQSCKIPLEVNFQNQSNNATQFQWIFDDSTTSTIEAPVHIYNEARNYSVKLIAINNAGCKDSITQNDIIKIKFPTTEISNFPLPGCAPIQATPIAHVTDADSIINYVWNFGDGDTSVEKNPVHIYNNRGEFDVSLSISTANGCIDTVYYHHAIIVGNKPHTLFSAEPTATCASTAVIFSDLTPLSDSVQQWDWNFGDGATSNLQNPHHNYVDTSILNDAFDVTLITTDNGCKDTSTISNYIQIYPPIAEFSYSNDCVNKLIKSFFDESKGAESWLWNFGDGHTSIEKNPVHIFSHSGPFVVTLIVYNQNSGCSDTSEQNVNVVNERPDFLSPDTSICKMSSANFQVINITENYFPSITWDFGNGINGFGNTTSTIFATPGSYDVLLFSQDINGCNDTISKKKYVTVSGPNADFNSSTLNTCRYSNIDFSDNSSTDGRNPIVNSIWIFGDGFEDTTTSNTTTHYFSHSGFYSVTLKVIDSAGCSDEITKNNIIFIDNPVSNFETTDSIICRNSMVSLINLSSGNGNNYEWHFGDGMISSLENPDHIYTQYGNNSIELITTNSIGCKDTLIKSNYIHVYNPIASFSVSDSIGNCPPLIVNFSNHSQYYSTQLWSFGDETNTILDNPSHFYSVSGNFTARLIVSSNSGCSDTAYKTIIVHGPRGTFDFNISTECSPVNVEFSANAINTQYFIWDFSDGITNITSDSFQVHSYNTSGHYTPKLLLKDSAGCVVTLTQSDSINVYSVHANFDINRHLICDSGFVYFNNTSYSNDLIAQYEWIYGDSLYSNENSPNHNYRNIGIFSPQLIVHSIHGCVDTATELIPIKLVQSPNGTITQSPNGCAGISIEFNGRLTSVDTSRISWSWNFGNGATADVNHPDAQYYAIAGFYPVKAILTNEFGCSDTISTSVEVYPYPNTDVGTDTTICKGSPIGLQAIGAENYTWSPSRGLSCIDCSNPITNTDSAVMYTVTGSTVHGCSTKDSIWVDVKYPFNLSVSEKQSICIGSSKLISASGSEQYSWSPALGLDNIHGASTNASPVNSTIYQVIGTDSKHCFSDTAYVPVVVYHYPTVDAGSDKSINVGQSIELIPRLSSDVTSVRWIPSGIEFRSTDGAIIVKPNETTNYEVEVSNAGGCKSNDVVTVNVLCNGSNLFIPNAFSPNNDGVNDVFYPIGTGINRIKSMRIFSRWGEVVFEKYNFRTNDASMGWNGKYKGNASSNEAFVYIIEVECDNNTSLVFKGNLLLLK